MSTLYLSLSSFLVLSQEQRHPEKCSHGLLIHTSLHSFLYSQKTNASLQWLVFDMWFNALISKFEAIVMRMRHQVHKTPHVQEQLDLWTSLESLLWWRFPSSFLRGPGLGTWDCRGGGGRIWSHVHIFFATPIIRFWNSPWEIQALMQFFLSRGKQDFDLFIYFHTHFSGFN